MKITDISEVALLEVFTDDHILCAKIVFQTQDEETREMELCYIGWEGVAACKYAHDSVSAKQDLLKLINEQWEADAQDADDAMGDSKPWNPSESISGGIHSAETELNRTDTDDHRLPVVFSQGN